MRKKLWNNFLSFLLALVLTVGTVATLSTVSQARTQHVLPVVEESVSAAELSASFSAAVSSADAEGPSDSAEGCAVPEHPVKSVAKTISSASDNTTSFFIFFLLVNHIILIFPFVWKHYFIFSVGLSVC